MFSGQRSTELTNQLVRVAKRGTRSKIFEFLKRHEREYTVSLAGRLALSDAEPPKLGTAFNFSAPRNNFLALSSKPFYDRLVYMNRPHVPHVLLHHADPLSDHRIITGYYSDYATEVPGVGGQQRHPVGTCENEPAP